jgi:hypothetical protein
MTSPSEAKLEILADPESLTRRVADWLLAAATAKDGVFAVALSGGSTPRRLYQLPAGPPYRDTSPWSRTHWIWGDERFVPHDDTLSSYRMVRDTPLPVEIVPFERQTVRDRLATIGCASPGARRSRRMAAITSPTAPSPRCPIQRRWKPGSRRSSAASDLRHRFSIAPAKCWSTEFVSRRLTPARREFFCERLRLW